MDLRNEKRKTERLRIRCTFSKQKHVNVCAMPCIFVRLFSERTGFPETSLASLRNQYVGLIKKERSFWKFLLRDDILKCTDVTNAELSFGCTTEVGTSF